MIDLSDIDARSDRKNDQKFKFIDDENFSGRPGELKYDGRYLKADVDGDSDTDFVVKVLTDVNLTSDHFLL